MVAKRKNKTISDLYYEYQLCIMLREREYKERKMNNTPTSEKTANLVKIENKILEEINNYLQDYLKDDKKN